MTQINATIALDMVAGNLYSDPTVDQTYLATEVTIDPSNYTGLLEARFEIVGLGGVGVLDPDELARLVDENGTVYATLTWDNTSPDRQHVVFTPNAATRKYYIRTIASGEANLNFREGRVLLDVQDPTQLRPQIPLISGDESSGGLLEDVTENNYWSYACSSNHDTYGYAGSGSTGPGTVRRWFRQFLYTSANWATIDHWTLTVIGGRDRDVPGTGHAALFNKTTGLMVAGTELTFTETAPTVKSIDFLTSATNFTAGHEFELRVKWVTDGDPSFLGLLVYRADLYPTLTPVTKFESHLRVGSPIVGSFPTGFSAGYEITCRTLYDPTKFTPATPFYFECTGQETGGAASLLLSDAGTFDKGLFSFVQFATDVNNLSGPTWTNPDKAEGAVDGGPIASTDALITFAASGGAEGVMEATLFGFDAVLPVRAVTGVFVELFASVYDSGLTPGTSAGRFSVQAAVSGTPIGSYLTQLCPESETTPGNIITNSIFYTLTTQAAWVRNDFLDANFALRLKNSNVWSGGNAGRTFGINAVRVTVEMALDIAASELNFSTSLFERKRTADLTASLTSGNRYVVHYANISSGQTLGNHSAPFLIAIVAGSTGSRSASPSPSASVSPSSSPSRSLSSSFSPSPSEAGGPEECYDPFAPSPGASATGA